MNARVRALALPLGLALLVLPWVPARAAAHPGPGAPPEFVLGDCITSVDAQQSDAIAFDYNVGYDDVTFGLGEIQLPDSKTHQFFALSGAVVRDTVRGGYQLFPFDADVEQGLPLPLWLDRDDVERAAAAAGPIDMTNFTAAQVAELDVLAARPELAPYLHPLGDKTTRVPISEEQARMGVRWDLSSVPAGVYTLAGYVFSPPFNDWAPRPGLIAVVQGATAVPAAVIEPIDAFVYAGQGRRVRGCVAAPAGSSLRAWVRAEDQPDTSWEPWLDDVAITGDRFELCWPNLAPGRAGLLRVRVEVTAPDGQRSAAYSPDTLLAVATPAACTESANACCEQHEPASDSADAGMTSTVAAAGSAADRPVDRPQPDAAAAVPTDDGPRVPPPAATPPAPPAGPAQAAQTDRDSGGCDVREATTSHRGYAWLLLWVVFCSSRKRTRSAFAQTGRAC